MCEPCKGHILADALDVLPTISLGEDHMSHLVAGASSYHETRLSFLGRRKGRDPTDLSGDIDIVIEMPSVFRITQTGPLVYVREVARPEPRVPARLSPVVDLLTPTVLLDVP